MPAQLPLMGGRHVFKIYDDDLTGDELVGSFTLEAKDVMAGMNGKFFWKNIYGSPLDCSGRWTEHMNENPEMGSLWKGRILMQVASHETEKPTLKVQDLSQERVQEALPYFEPRKFAIMAQVNAALALPTEKDKYEVQIRIAEKEINTGAP